MKITWATINETLNRNRKSNDFPLEFIVNNESITDTKDIANHFNACAYSMCSLVVSILDSPAVDPRSNPGSGSALLMSEKSQAVYYMYISSCHMLIDKSLSMQ